MATVATLAFTAEPPARASLQSPFLGSIDGGATPEGSFGRIVGVAVNSNTGDIWIADNGNDAVYELAASGALLETITGPPGETFGNPLAVAVDEGTGHVWVADDTRQVVYEFTSGGALLRTLTGPAEGRFINPLSVAVNDMGGELWVADNAADAVYEFSAAGSLLKTITGPPEGVFSNPVGVAVDSANGDVWVLDSGNELVYEFSATGELLHTIGGLPEEPFINPLGVAVNDGSGEVWVVDNGTNTVDNFAPSGAPLTTTRGTPIGAFANLIAVGVNSSSGDGYVGDSEARMVDVFGAAINLPDVVTGEATNVGVSSARLAGTVNPAGTEITGCRFEYGTDTSYGSATACDETPGEIGSGEGNVALGAEVSGLRANATYHYRLVINSANGASYGRDAVFHTESPPLIEAASAREVTATTAVLSAKINPEGHTANYRFEYGTDTSYGVSAPKPDGTVAAGEAGVDVSVGVGNLVPDTTYHWRVVATSANGTTRGPDHTFVYSTAGTQLPDTRAYERVTPSFKSGSLVTIDPMTIASDGSALMAGSFGGFAGAGNDEFSGQVVGVWYSFTRTASGWQSSVETPPATAMTHARVQSLDPPESVWSDPLADEGDHFFLRAADGSLSDIGPVWPPTIGAQETGIGQYLLLGAAADGSHIVFQIVKPTLDWPFDTTADVSLLGTLYEYSGTRNAAPQLVGVTGGSGSTALVSQCDTVLGSPAFEGSMYNAVSESGAMAYFTAIHGAPTAPFRVSTCSGSEGFTGSAPTTNEVYGRVNDTETTWVSEPMCTRVAPACTNVSTSTYVTAAQSEAAAVNFEGASADGSKVFFTTTQQLTNGDTDGTVDLYMYDFSAPAGARLSQVSVGDSSDPTPGAGAQVQGVSRISEDGSHVYFVARGVLTTEASGDGSHAQPGADNLYVYSAHRIRFITALCSDAGKSGTGADPACPESLNGAGPGSGEQNDQQLWSEDGWDRRRPFDVTPDGRFAVFASYGDLTADDIGSARQVFEYDALTETLTRVSIGANGFGDNGNAESGDASIAAPDYTMLEPMDSRGGAMTRTMSDDGAYVFFESPVALTARALNDVAINATGQLAQNIYEYHDGRVSLISDGKDVSAAGSLFEGAGSSVRLGGTTASGADVFFTTADSLLPEDTDTQVDIYDARVAGGFPQPAATPTCGGDDCPGAEAGAPPFGFPGSEALAGPGNLSARPTTRSRRHAARACHHGRRRGRRCRRRHVRVVKRSRHGRHTSRASLTKRAVGGGP